MAAKELLGARLGRIGIGLFARAYRGVAGAGFLVRHDTGFLRLLSAVEPAIFLCWHQDFGATLCLVSRTLPRRPIHVLASASRDGGLAVAAAEAVGFAGAVRGSSKGRGAAALLELERLGREEAGRSFVVVGDGPRPPARHLKPGAVHLAMATGLPIWCLRSSWWPDPSLPKTWARFHFPRLLHRGVALSDGPIRVAPNLDRSALDSVRRDLEARLNALADRADRLAERLYAR